MYYVHTVRNAPPGANRHVRHATPHSLGRAHYHNVCIYLWAQASRVCRFNLNDNAINIHWSSRTHAVGRRAYSSGCSDVGGYISEQQQQQPRRVKLGALVTCACACESVWRITIATRGAHRQRPWAPTATANQSASATSVRNYALLRIIINIIIPHTIKLRQKEREGQRGREGERWS